jgi:hypothetical protein
MEDDRQESPSPVDAAVFGTVSGTLTSSTPKLRDPTLKTAIS